MTEGYNYILRSTTFAQNDKRFLFYDPQHLQKAG